MSEVISFLDTNFTTSSRTELRESIDQASSRPLTIATVNAVFFLDAAKQPDFRAALKNMSLCTIDGSGPYYFLNFWRRLHKQSPLERYAGADLVADLFEKYQDGSKTFYLLGWEPDIPDLAEQAAKNLRAKYPNLKIVGAESGGKLDRTKIALDPELAERIKKAKPDILLAGFGAPKQELWMQAARNLDVPVMIGVGGTLKFYVNRPRAPHWMRTLGLEWLYRGFYERSHWGRVWRAVVVFSIYTFFWMLKTSLLRGKDRV